MEAQACGTPIYGYKTGGTMETYLQNEQHFVEYGDIESLALILSTISHKNQESISLLRKMAIEKVSQNQALINYCNIYKEFGI